jgi:Ca2+-binding EF-hand superfamily protein
LDLINQAFDKLDASGSGEVTVSDLKGVYSAEYHPKFQSGEWTEEEVFQYWLQQFGGDENGTVSEKYTDLKKQSIDQRLFSHKFSTCTVI